MNHHTIDITDDTVVRWGSPNAARLVSANRAVATWGDTPEMAHAWTASRRRLLARQTHKRRADVTECGGCHA
jgi:hypothetical protein